MVDFFVEFLSERKVGKPLRNILYRLVKLHSVREMKKGFWINVNALVEAHAESEVSHRMRNESNRRIEFHSESNVG